MLAAPPAKVARRSRVRVVYSPTMRVFEVPSAIASSVSPFSPSARLWTWIGPFRPEAGVFGVVP
ncbi:MAG: hypothetical protein ACRC33_25485 [Gemmataceae bacterium]